MISSLTCSHGVILFTVIEHKIRGETLSIFANLFDDLKYIACHYDF